MYRAERSLARDCAIVRRVSWFARRQVVTYRFRLAHASRATTMTAEASIAPTAAAASTDAEWSLTAMTTLQLYMHASTRQQPEEGDAGSRPAGQRISCDVIAWTRANVVLLLSQRTLAHSLTHTHTDTHTHTHTHMRNMHTGDGKRGNPVLVRGCTENAFVQGQTLQSHALSTHEPNRKRTTDDECRYRDMYRGGCVYVCVCVCVKRKRV
jgi:hypothetical protein